MSVKQARCNTCTDSKSDVVAFKWVGVGEGVLCNVHFVAVGVVVKEMLSSRLY